MSCRKVTEHGSQAQGTDKEGWNVEDHSWESRGEAAEAGDGSGGLVLTRRNSHR